jgi:polyisoprenoid-binding protein YceI
MGGGQDTPMNDAADPDDLDDMLDLPGDGERSTNALSLLLALIGMIFIPLGLILVFLAFARGDNAKQSTAQTVVPEFAPGMDSLAGRWLIVRGDSSWVSYQATGTPPATAQPILAELRSFKVDGGIVIVATSPTAGNVTGVALNADLTDSGNAAVDAALRTEGLETATYPYAEFLIPDTDPIAVPRVPPFGDHLDLRAKGQLTLHGVTKTIEVKLTATLIQGDPVLIELTGTMPLNVGDFGIKPAMTGEVTFHLRLARAPDEVSGKDPHGSTTLTSTPGSQPTGSAPARAPGSTPPGSAVVPTGATGTTSKP